jgi:spermidine synthase
MPNRVSDQRGFDPEFDDTEWTSSWLHVPVAAVPPGIHPSGYRVVRRILHETEVFGRPYHLAAPLDCRLLFDPEGRLWMSDTPQERIMMYNNGRRSHGHVLVGGLGLGLYPQYAVVGAAGQARRFTAVERSPVVRAIVEPTLSVALDVPLKVITGDVMDFLSGPVTTRYDTIFLDTWETLDAAHLPLIHRLRDLALGHLAPGGRVLLWGYRWMLRLFEEACRQLLRVAPAQRRSWLATRAGASPQGVALLTPVVDHFQGQVVEEEAALAWCRQYITLTR